MNLKLISGGAELAVSDATFGQDYNETLVHQVVVAYRNAGRAGTMKRHNFAGHHASHGVSVSHRTPGSIGQRQTPGRVFQGKRMSGHMGVVRRTIENLKVVEVDVERNLLLIRGAVPGSEGGRVIVRLSVKTQRQAGRKTIVPTKQAPANKTPNPAKAGKK